MPKGQDGYTPLQAHFLLRLARLSRLYYHYEQRTAPLDELMLLVCWALRSTLVDCVCLDVGPEAEALFSTRHEAWG